LIGHKAHRKVRVGEGGGPGGSHLIEKDKNEKKKRFRNRRSSGEIKEKRKGKQ